MLDDIALVSLNGDTFQVTLGEDDFSEIDYLSSVSALDTASGRLPNIWPDITGNIYDLFFNDVDNPLRFVSYDDTVKMTMLKLCGYSNFALSAMHELYMTLDQEDPSSVHFEAVIDDNPVTRIYFDDLDVDLEFGKAESDPRIAKWTADPVYPEARTAWSEDDFFYLNSVFLSGSEESPLPFPEFAGYALKFDDEVFSNNESILLTDAHATESDVEAYKKQLTDNGFEETEITDASGTKTVYRKLMRPDYAAYASAYPYYDNGFVLEADTFHDDPHYESLAEINTVLGKTGFAELPKTEVLTEWEAIDTRASRSESWLYFFDYDLSLIAKADFENMDDVLAYLEDYGKLLEDKGYHAVMSSDGETLEDYESPNGYSVFKYDFDENGLLRLQFRNEKGFAADEAAGMIKDAGFPEITFHGNFSSREISRYHKMTRAFDGKIYLSASQPFDTQEEAEKFLDEYTARLEDAGFFYFNPEAVGTMKRFAYYNEEEDKFFAFDLFPDEDETLLNMDFVDNNP
jgi:hypothetical protein